MAFFAFGVEQPFGCDFATRRAHRHQLVRQQLTEMQPMTRTETQTRKMQRMQARQMRLEPLGD
jgi:hypothetical protein